MTTSIDVFRPHILPIVIGCPDFSVDSAVIEAAIQFCTESNAWTEILEIVQVGPSAHSYELDIPSDARALLIHNVWAVNGELMPKSMDDIALLVTNWQSAKGTPAYYNQQNWDEFRIYPIPSTKEKLTVRASLAPKRNTTKLPDFLVDRNFQAIVSGAIARLMMVPGQAWSNPELAMYHKGEFALAVGESKVEIFHDRVQGSVRVAPRPFR